MTLALCCSFIESLKVQDHADKHSKKLSGGTKRKVRSLYEYFFCFFFLCTSILKDTDTGKHFACVYLMGRVVLSHLPCNSLGDICTLNIGAVHCDICVYLSFYNQWVKIIYGFQSGYRCLARDELYCIALVLQLKVTFMCVENVVVIWLQFITGS